MTMSKHRSLSRAFLTAAVASVLGATLAAQLDGKIGAELDRLLGMPVSSDKATTLRDQIWRSCAIRHGELKPLLEDLAARPQVRDDVADDLSRAVPGHLAAAVALVHFDPALHEFLFAHARASPKTKDSPALT